MQGRSVTFLTGGGVTSKFYRRPRGTCERIKANGLVFMSTTYSCFVLSRVGNYFVIEPKNSKKQIRPGKHGNIIFICP